MEVLEKMTVLHLVSGLRSALYDHHTGLMTTRPFRETYERDEELIKRADEMIANLTKGD